MFQMKIFFCLALLLFITIDCIQSQKALRTFIVHRESIFRNNRLSNYTIYDASEKTIVYRVKTIFTDIDTMMLIDYPAKNVIANVEGDWARGIFNVSLSIYSSKAQKWIDGIMRTTAGFLNKYAIYWDGKEVIVMYKFLSNKKGFYDKDEKVKFGRFSVYSKWYQTAIKYKVEIYSNYVPDAIYFFSLAIADQRFQVRPRT